MIAPDRAARPLLLAAALATAASLSLPPASPARAEAPAAAPAAGAAPDRMARLVGLTHVWLEARIAHPAMLRGTIDLDAAAVAAIPKIEAAKTKQDYAAAITGLLAVFKDPATRLEDPAATPAPPTVPVKLIETPTPKLVVVTLSALADPATQAQAGTLIATLPLQLQGAEIAMFDLRAPGFESSVDGFVDNAATALPVIEQWSLSRSIEHRGFRTQQGITSGGYESIYALAPRTTWQRGNPQSSIKHVVFVVDARSPLPEVALGLWASGKATIVSPDPLSDARTAVTREVELPWGLVAHVRAEEIVMPDGTAITADVAVPAKASPHAAGLALAKQLLAGAKPPARRRGPVVPAAPPVLRDDRDWPEAAYPPRELRIFAAMRAWGLLARFFPYLDLVKDWDARLPSAILATEAATDAKSYRDALRALGAHLRDGHVGVYALPYEIRGMPWLEVRLVERRPIVTEIRDPELGTLGVRIGDEVVSIDGVPVDQRRAELRPVTTGGTAAALENRVLETMLHGPRSQSVVLELRGADAKPRTVKLPRDRPRPPDRSGPHYKLLDGDVGYADLRLLTRDEVDAMFAAFAKTRAILLDMRGYPNGTAWPIAPHINTKRAAWGALFVQPLVRARDPEYGGLGTQFLQPLPQDPAIAPYRGRIAVLIDDRAISQSEHSCLFFESAAAVTFIGSPTHGSNGDVTTMRLPGGLRMTFTGQAVRHVDGRQLQQLGIQPTIPVAPTLAGIRAGKDEVLERGIAWAKTSR